MVSARELLAVSQVSRPATADDLEILERQAPASTQIKVVSVGPEGITGTTADGGEITVSSTAQNFTPRAGDILPVNFTPGVARAVDNSRQQPQETAPELPVPIVQSRAPTATDSSVPYQQWLDISPDLVDGVRLAELWMLLPQLGAWHKISGQGGGVTIRYENGPPELDPTDPINNPPPHAPINNQIWHDTSIATFNGNSTGREWRYDQANNVYRNISGNIIFYNADPTANGVSPDSLVDGDLLIARDGVNDVTWTYRWISATETWIGASCCPDQPEEPPEDICGPGSIAEPVTGGWSCTAI